MTQPADAAPPDAWWQGAVGYEVYLRSFADSDGDGVGDLPGLLDRLDYLAWLGVEIVWITPCYPSPMLDGGYDVADYRDIDAAYGTLADFDAVVAKAHDLGLRVLVDLVPNHTSSRHPWFAAARSGRDDPRRDSYLWRDPAPDGGPPNNWPSHFGGPAWTLDEASGQYWCHLFLPEQPDLNWGNETVRAEFDAILRFWLDRGADGFRIDVAHGLVKHPDFPDLPELKGDEAELGLVTDYDRFQHVYDVNQPGNLDVYRRWRDVATPYDALLLGEVYLHDTELLSPYVVEQDGLHAAFWFKPLHLGWDAAALAAALRIATETVAPHVAWISGSHDRARAVTRFGGGELGRRRALAFSTLLFGLPGMAFLYQGEELGLTDGVIAPEDAQDPVAVRAGEHEHSRDGCRTPMPWEPGPGLGFTSAERAWLPFGDRAPADTMAVQREAPDSVLHRYRALIAWRRSVAGLHDAPVEWLSDGPVIAYRRGGVVVAANCGDAEVEVPLPPGEWEVAFTTEAQPGRRLPPAEARILRLR